MNAFREISTMADRINLPKKILVRYTTFFLHEFWSDSLRQNKPMWNAQLSVFWSDWLRQNKPMWNAQLSVFWSDWLRQNKPMWNAQLSVFWSDWLRQNKPTWNTQLSLFYFPRTVQTSCSNRFMSRRAWKAAVMTPSPPRVCISRVDRKESPGRSKVCCFFHCGSQRAPELRGRFSVAYYV